MEREFIPPPANDPAYHLTAAGQVGDYRPLKGRIKTKERYQALSPTGHVLAIGARLQDVEGMGPRILVDYKLKRWTWVGRYPLTRYNWRAGLAGLGDLLRKGAL